MAEVLVVDGGEGGGGSSGKNKGSKLKHRSKVKGKEVEKAVLNKPSRSTRKVLGKLVGGENCSPSKLIPSKAQPQVIEKKYVRTRVWDPTRLPSMWGPYRKPDGKGGYVFNNDALLVDKDAYDGPSNDKPTLTPAQRKTEAREWASLLPTYCANAALEFYNTEFWYPEFELVDAEVQGLNVIVCDGIWYHLNFKARPKIAADDIDASPKLFFAELCQTGSSDMDMKVTLCSILDHTAQGGMGCLHCGPMGKIIRHPAHGFERGVPLSELQIQLQQIEIQQLVKENPYVVATCKSSFVTSDLFWDFDMYYEFMYRIAHKQVVKPVSPLTTPTERRAQYREVAQEQAMDCAESALEYLNKENGNDYELVCAVSSNFVKWYPGFYHANFTARRRKADAAARTNPSTEFFFAELCTGRVMGKFKLIVCTKLDIKSPDVRAGCGICLSTSIADCPAVLHPADGYTVVCTSKTRNTRRK